MRTQTICVPAGRRSRVYVVVHTQPGLDAYPFIAALVVCPLHWTSKWRALCGQFTHNLVTPKRSRESRGKVEGERADWLMCCSKIAIALNYVLQRLANAFALLFRFHTHVRVYLCTFSEQTMDRTDGYFIHVHRVAIQSVRSVAARCLILSILKFFSHLRQREELSDCLACTSQKFHCVYVPEQLAGWRNASEILNEILQISLFAWMLENIHRYMNGSWKRSCVCAREEVRTWCCRDPELIFVQIRRVRQ